MKRIFTQLLSVLLLTILSQNVFSQTLATGQCEQQPCQALAVCNNPTINQYAYQGGAAPSGLAGITGCGSGTFVANWMYYRFKATSTGTLNFTISANSGTCDLDFILFQINNSACNVLTNANKLACNNEGIGPTGCNTAGAPAINFAPTLNVTAGQEFILAISRSTGGSGIFPSDPSGFNIAWSGTANVVDNDL